MKNVEVRPQKKTYTTPTLSTHGDVATLTQTPVDGSGIIILR